MKTMEEMKKQSKSTPITKYKCGHESKLVVMDNSPVSLATWMRWSETVGFHGDNSMCWKCWCKEQELNKQEDGE